MKPSLMRLIARCLAAVLLTAQFAIAAYACPVLAAPAAGVAQHGHADAAEAIFAKSAMADCGDAVGSVDQVLPNLCAAHCEVGKQGSHAATGVMMPFPSWPVALYDLVHVPLPALGRPAASTISALVAAAPVHAILHCVRRT